MQPHSARVTAAVHFSWDLKPKQLITRTWPTLCNPGQRRAGQVLIRNRGVNIGQVKGVNIPFRLT